MKNIFPIIFLLVLFSKFIYSIEIDIKKDLTLLKKNDQDFFLKKCKNNLEVLKSPKCLNYIGIKLFLFSYNNESFSVSYKDNLLVSFFYSLKDLKLYINQLTKINCLIVKKLISKYYIKKILYKKPNDLLVNQKKVCGILQETIEKLDEKYLIVGIGINLNKSPNIKNYPTTNLGKLLNKKISKKKIEIKLKNIFQIELSKLYRFN